MPNGRLLILGLDGAAPDLVEEMIDAGELPTLAALRAEGVFGLLRSSINCVTPSAWTSMATGVGPGRHGLFNFIEYVPSNHGIRVPDSRRRRSPAIWDLAGDAGRRCCILRVPMTFPASPVHGWLVADALAPSVRHEGFAWPPELADQLVNRFGASGWGEKWGDDTPVVTGRYGRALRQLLSGMDRGFDLIEFALSHEDWDLLFAVVHEPDEAGHYFWHLMDHRSPHHDPTAARRHGDGLRRVYRRMDERIGSLVRKLPADTTMLVVSDHGLGARRTAAWHLRALLIAAGFQVSHDAPEEAGGVRQGLLGMRRAITRRIPWEIRRRLRPLSGEARERGASQALLGSIDWHSTAAFTLGAGYAGEIWVNLAGRCPAGAVQPGEQHTATLEALRALLRSTLDAASRRAVVERIDAGGEVCPGPCSESIPDLLVTFDESLDCDAVTATNPFTHELVTVDGDSPGHWALPHRGFHRRDGLLLAVGPGIARHGEPLRATVADIAPTALYLLGLPLPEDMDGRLIDALVEPEMLRKRPPTLGPPLATRDVADAAFSDADRAKVEERLRELGYL